MKFSDEFRILESLKTPEDIQTFLEDIPFNHELDGETCMSPLRVLQEGRAHCIEGALLACVALMIHGEKPFIMNLKVKESDYDHIVTVFKRSGRYGAISKTNHSVLRYRDPVYTSVRELAMSYFHEYFLVTSGEKTMLGYTDLINVKRFGSRWMTRGDDLWDIAEVIFDMPCNQIAQRSHMNELRRATECERDGADIPEWPKG